ncbi:MAG: ABC transporter ATP-binding protein [Odoribacteraceae bacterium]|jgi:ABC-2 type transport system ATP-binding protein|nr:ABC transporter ATP-binding protein [Odoribacteraceae bacterium]
MDVLTVERITKRYGAVTALEEVSLVVPEGVVYGILGPNGSGKTTLLGIVTDALKPSAGSYRFFDGARPGHEARKEMGVLLETPNFYPYLSARENLTIVARIKGRDPAGIREALRAVNLLERQHAPFKTYSLGMKQRLAIAAALLGDPRVVILDEPTNGLDPEGIAEIRELVRRVAGEGRTIILASHLLDEVEKVCSHVAILKRGRLLAAGDIRGVLSGAGDDGATGEIVTMEVAGGDPATLAAALGRLDGVLSTSVEGGAVTISCAAGRLAPGEVNRYCFENDIVLERLVAREKNLEVKFLELTK